MSSFKSPSGVQLNSFLYRNFRGIDTSRDIAALENGEAQHLISLSNGYADWRGVINIDRGASRHILANGTVENLRWFGRDNAVWVEKNEAGKSFVSDKGQRKEEVYAADAVVSTTVFDGEVVFATQSSPIYHFNGFTWKRNESSSSPDPAYISTVSGRLCLSGMTGSATAIWLSRLENPMIMPPDEDAQSTQVDKAVYIDIRNVVGSAETIKGLGRFESSRLAVFTEDRTLVYNISANYEQIKLDSSIQIGVGTISHNTIAEAGSDLIFCSRNGVQTIKRSKENGVTVYPVPMSAKIEEIYRSYVKSVRNPEQINAFFDQDENQYHIFFPMTDKLSRRLTLSLNPLDADNNTWSSSDFLNARCASVLGGRVLVGTNGGIWELKQYDDDVMKTPKMVINTPILWHESINTVKESHSFILQASGKGIINVEAFDEVGRQLSNIRYQIEDDVRNNEFPENPMRLEYERKFEHRYKGVQFRFKVEGDGLIKVIGFAVNTRKK